MSLASITARLALIAMLSVPVAAAAAPEAVYTVAPGDTLWDIAERLNARPWQWQRDSAGGMPAARPGDRVHRNAQGLALEHVEKPLVRLSPRMRQLPPREQITPIPMAPIRVWLTEHRIVENCCEQAGRVISGEDGRLVSGAGERIYARNVAGAPGSWFGLYSRGSAIRNEQGRLLGYSLVMLGEAQLEAPGRLATLTLGRTHREVSAGDLLLPREDDIPPQSLLPHPLGGGIEGRIVADPQAAQVIGNRDVISIDLGQRDGVTPGTVLGIYQRDTRVRDPQTGEWTRLPSRQIGTALVFRSYRSAGYALVMRLSAPASPGDRLAAPQS